MNLLRRKPTTPVVRRTAETFAIGGIWGSAIDWVVPGKKVVGCKDPRPMPGDFIESPMTSGRIGVYIVRSSKYERDPRDMFFADVEWHGYR